MDKTKTELTLTGEDSCVQRPYLPSDLRSQIHEVPFVRFVDFMRIMEKKIQHEINGTEQIYLGEAVPEMREVYHWREHLDATLNTMALFKRALATNEPHAIYTAAMTVLNSVIQWSGTKQLKDKINEEYSLLMQLALEEPNKSTPRP